MCRGLAIATASARPAGTFGVAVTVEVTTAAGAAADDPPAPAALPACGAPLRLAVRVAFLVCGVGRIRVRTLVRALVRGAARVRARVNCVRVGLSRVG
jgi:hypothetical protein